VKRLIVVIVIGLLFLGSMLAYQGFQKENSWMQGAGLASAGIAVCILGVDTTIQRESVEQDDAGNVTTYRGCSAILIGMMWILVGFIVVSFGILILVRQQNNLLEWLSKHPGIAFIAIGFVLLAFGGQEVLGSEEQKGSFWVVLWSMPGRFFGLLLISTGLILLFAGVLEVFFTGFYSDVLSSIQIWWENLKCQIQPGFCID
jgi:hypothetical protein